jgi:hypothetical protein
MKRVFLNFEKIPFGPKTFSKFKIIAYDSENKRINKRHLFSFEIMKELVTLCQYYR